MIYLLKTLIRTQASTVKNFSLSLLFINQDLNYSSTQRSDLKAGCMSQFACHYY